MKKRLAALIPSILIFLMGTTSLAEEVTLKKAIDIAVKVMPGEVLRAEREKEWYEIKIRSKEGEIKEFHVDMKDGSIVEDKKIALDEAIEVAKKQVPGDVLKVDYERGRYEVKIISKEMGKIEVYVDAHSGKIVKIEKE